MYGHTSRSKKIIRSFVHHSKCMAYFQMKISLCHISHLIQNHTIFHTKDRIAKTINSFEKRKKEENKLKLNGIKQ